ncbi:MAG: methyl-accepting chemotaxis protein [Kineosporiaceae bacterium]|nr:methyl-accepting chemotaxis protein [Kineosporiaceae bacterium]
MRVTVARRLTAAALIGIGAITLVGGIALYGGQRQSQTAQTMARVSAGMSRQWNADMMHDGIRADVMSALYATSAAERTSLDVEGVGEKATDMVAHLRAAAAAAPAPLQAEYADALPAVQQYGELATQLVSLAGRDRAAAQRRLPVFLQQFDALEESLGRIDEDMLAAVEDQQRQMLSTARTARWLTLGIGGGTIAVLAGFSWILGRTIVTSVRRVESALLQVAEGDLTVRVPVTTRDELGTMSRAVNVALERIGETITDAGAAAAALATECSGLNQLSTSLGRAASMTAGQTHEASNSVRDVSDHVRAMSEATEQMEAAIGEIAGQTATASTVAAEAARGASATRATVVELNRASEEIGEIVQAITAIAEQTNLLALNATIEAARAGEAGKGFAVVATEVKELAQETGRATQDITDKISTIQSITAAAAESIADITAVIDRINENTGMIAAAVEQQSATTSEINRNVSEVSRGADRINASMHDIAGSTGETSRGADETERVAVALSAVAVQVNAQIRRFTV